MHMFSESSSANTSTLRTNNENFAKYDTYYYQVHQQIDLIRKYKLSSDLNSKEKEDQLVDCKKALESLNEDFLKLKLENDRLKNELEQSESSKVESTQRIELLSNAVRIIKNELNDVEKRIQSYDESNKMYMEDTQKKNKSIESLRFEVEKCIIEKKQFKDECVAKVEAEKINNETLKLSYEKEVSQLKNELHKRIEEIAARDHSIIELEKKLQENEHLIAKIKKESADLESKIKEFEETLKREYENGQKLKEKLENLNRIINDSEARNQDLEANNKNLEAKIKDLDANNKDLEANSKDLETKNKDYQNIIAEKIVSENDMKAKLEKFESDNSEFSNQINNKMKQIEDLNNKIVQLNELRDAQIKELNFNNEIKINELSQYHNDKAIDLELKIEHLNKDHEAIKSMYTEKLNEKEKLLQDEINAHNLQVTLLTQEKNESIAKLKKDLEEYKDKYQEILKKQSVDKTELTDKNEIISHMQFDHRNLKASLNDFQEKINLYEDKIKSMEFKEKEIKAMYESELAQAKKIETLLNGKLEESNNTIDVLSANKSMIIQPIKCEISTQTDRGSLKRKNSEEYRIGADKKQIKPDIINDSIKVSQINKENKFPKQEASQLTRSRTPRSCQQKKDKFLIENSSEADTSQENQNLFISNKTNTRRKNNEQLEYLSEINNLTKTSAEDYNRKKLNRVASNQRKFTNVITATQEMSQTQAPTQVPTNSLSANRPKRRVITSTPSDQTSSQVSSLKLSGVPKDDDDDIFLSYL